MNHPHQPELLALVRGSASAEEAETVWGHLGVCPECEERYRALRRLRDDLDSELAGMGLAEGPPPVVRIRGLLEAGLGALASVFPGGGDSFLVPAPATPGGIGHPDGNPGDARQGADDAWEAGRPGEARSLLGDLFRVDPRTAERREVVLHRDGREALRVVIDADRREVAVLLYTGLEEMLVFLVPEASPIRRAEVEPVEGADYHLALFGEVAPGRFDIVLERP